MSLPRGFKANAERESLQLRRELGLAPAQALDVTRLAGHLGVEIISAGELVDVTRLEELERIQAYSFSAATFEVAGRTFIIAAPCAPPPARPATSRTNCRTCCSGTSCPRSARSAACPSAPAGRTRKSRPPASAARYCCPRPLLVSAARHGLGPQQIAEKYNVTLEMARFRYNSTGVRNQVPQTATR